MRSRVLPPWKAEPLRKHLPALIIWSAIVGLVVLAILAPTLGQPLKGLSLAMFVTLVIGVLVWR